MDNMSLSGFLEAAAIDDYLDRIITQPHNENLVIAEALADIRTQIMNSDTLSDQDRSFLLEEVARYFADIRPLPLKLVTSMV